MKKTIKGVIVGAASLAILGAVSPAASANAAGDTIRGGCHFDTNEQQIATNGQNEGVIGDVSVTTDSSGAPTGATVTCVIEVNGVKQLGTQHSYTGVGVQAGSDQIVFSAGTNDTVLLCEDVTYADTTTEVENCPAATSQQIPPQPVIDLINGLFASTIDPVVCPALITLGQLTGGGVAGVVTIDSTGDVSVIDPLGLGINPVYDCPPYVVV
ncbi:MAG: hypothetical protein QOD07_2387 [Frankiaceae bacterium]|nr:hypothetical protein [Frankiaceae bacterium]